MRRLAPAKPKAKRQIDEALQLMRRARRLLREAGAPKATQKINGAITSAEGARRHCERRPMISEP
ncbi:hypothetical protein [Pseudomonas sp.]|uniref:hypothetical protein n=1 Tax=Pseudomonas sp. TaxID=306 RepID=UPI003D11D7C3